MKKIVTIAALCAALCSCKEATVSPSKWMSSFMPAAATCQYRIDIPLVDGTALHYNASSYRQEIVPDEIGTADGKYMVVVLCPEGTESWIHYCIMEGGCYMPGTNTPIEAAHCKDGGWCVPPFIYVTGYPAILSIVGYKVRQPLPSNVAG